MGWRIIPLCWTEDDGSCGYSGHNKREKCTSAGKRAILDDWPNRATSDPVIAAQWWRQPSAPLDTEEWYPLASIGLVLGEDSGVFALDVDPEHGGLERLEALQQRHGPLPPTRVHQTGSGGEHYLWRHPGFRVHNLKPWGKDAGLDVKGDRGYIVLPPSRSYKGEYTVSAVMAEAEVLVAPEWILEPLRSANAAQHGERTGNAEALPTRLLSRYTESALKGEAFAVAGAPDGDMNNSLNNAALKLGSLGAHGLISEDEARNVLRDACVQNGYIHWKGIGAFEATFRSGWKAGLARPRDLAGIGGLTEQEWPILPWDDFGLSDRMVVYYGDQMRWVEDWQTWMTYRAGSWSRQFVTEAERLAETMMRLLRVTEKPLYAGDGDGDNENSPRQKFEAWLTRSSTHAKVASTVKLARHRPSLRASPDQFDGQPAMLNVTNGIVSLEGGTIAPHSPESMLTLKAAADFNPRAVCPRWEAFLARVQPDPEIRSYLQRITGYSATGSIREQVFFLHHGTGANGKSVFHDVVMHVLGSYVQSVPVEALMASGADRIPNDIARMVGRRYLTASETKAGRFLDEARLKQLTGGDTISARFMRGEYFEFKPVGKIHLITNQLPRLSEDSATWRRIHLIPWGEVIPESERDGLLAERLIREESEGILRWIVEGATQWFAIGLSAPSTSIEAKEEYERDEQTLGRWIEEACNVFEVTDDTRLASGGERGVLYAHYKMWMQTNGFQPVNNRNFHSEMKTKGFRESKSHGRRGYLGISVRMDAQS